MLENKRVCVSLHAGVQVQQMCLCPGIMPVLISEYVLCLHACAYVDLCAVSLPKTYNQIKYWQRKTPL